MPRRVSIMFIGLICGFAHALRHFYVTSFVLMNAHRAHRDIARCRRRYGDDRDQYTAEAPYVFLPGVL